MDEIAKIAQDALMKPLGPPMTGEEFLRFLGADDEEIAAPIGDDSVVEG